MIGLRRVIVGTVSYESRSRCFWGSKGARRLGQRVIGHCVTDRLQKQRVVQLSFNFLCTAFHSDSHKRRSVASRGENRGKRNSGQH